MVLHDYRHWCRVYWTLPPKSSQSHPGSGGRVHHCSTKYIHIFARNGMSCCLHIANVHHVFLGSALPAHVTCYPAVPYVSTCDAQQQ